MALGSSIIMRSFLAVLALVAVATAGCLDTADPGQEDVAEGDAEATADRADAAPTKPSPDAEVLLDQRFEAVMGQQGSANVAVPDGATRVWLQMGYDGGVFQEPAFTLGSCDGVSTYGGTWVIVPMGGEAGQGAWTPDAWFDCGWLEAGDHELSWRVEVGQATGTVKILADPA